MACSNVWFFVCSSRSRTEPAFFTLNHHEALYCAIQRHAWRYVHQHIHLLHSIQYLTGKTYVCPHFFLYSPTHLFHRTPGGATPASSDKKASFNTVSPHLLYHNHLTTPNISTLTLPIKSSTAYAPQLPLQRLPSSLCRSPLFHHPFRYRRVFPFSHTLASSSS